MIVIYGHKDQARAGFAECAIFERMGPSLRIGVSACLLGEQVRYDGGHKRDPFLVEVLGRYAEWVPVCPEVECGLGTPRDPIRLERRAGRVRLIVPKTGADLTQDMFAFSQRRARELERQDLDGYIFKKDSPSCGLERVRIYGAGNVPDRAGRGLFAETIAKHFPHLPVEEEGRLHEPRVRESFVTHVFAYRRWKEMHTAGASRAALMRFHQQHKFVLMARSQAGAARLGRLLGSATGAAGRALAGKYLDGFTEIMRRPPTPRGHTNVLQHMAGYVSDLLDRDDREELTDLIARYRRGLLPLLVPVTLLRHYVRKFDLEYLQGQVYLEPQPHELMLLNCL